MVKLVSLFRPWSLRISSHSWLRRQNSTVKWWKCLTLPPANMQTNRAMTALVSLSNFSSRITCPSKTSIRGKTSPKLSSSRRTTTTWCWSTTWTLRWRSACYRSNWSTSWSKSSTTRLSPSFRPSSCRNTSPANLVSRASSRKMPCFQSFACLGRSRKTTRCPRRSSSTSAWFLTSFRPPSGTTSFSKGVTCTF